MVISEATALCLQSFSECLAVEALMKDKWADSRLADFNLWVSGVGASAKGRASLDSRLATRPEERTVIANILQLLAEVVNDCKRLALSETPEPTSESRNEEDLGERPAALAPDEPPARPFSPWSDESSGSELESEPQEASTNNLLDDSMQNIERMLDQLVQIAVAVRRSGRRSRLQKADQRFKPSDHKELEEHLSTVLLARPGFSKEEIDPSKLSEIQRRLIRCNLKRRNRFLYAQQHSKGLDPLSTANQPAPVIAINSADERPGGSNQRSLPVNLKKTREDGDAKTGTSASAISDSFRLDTSPVLRPAASTIMSTTVIDLEYPRPPNTKKDAHLFRCPCCCVTLPVALLDRNRWRKHVADDVSPYTCILTGCKNPDILYNTKDSWRKHLVAEHSSFDYWVCFACGDHKQFYSENDFIVHTRTVHAESVPQVRIQLLTSFCKRSAPIDITSCPLCTWPKGEEGEVDKDVLLDHIAKEIHAFSLRALPWTDNNGQEIDERIDYSADKVYDWLVANNLSVNPNQERSSRKKIPCTSEYLQQNAYVGGSSKASSSSELDTVLSREAKLEKLKDEDSPVSFGSKEDDALSELGDEGSAKSFEQDGDPHTPEREARNSERLMREKRGREAIRAADEDQDQRDNEHNSTETEADWDVVSINTERSLSVLESKAESSPSDEEERKPTPQSHGPPQADQSMGSSSQGSPRSTLILQEPTPFNKAKFPADDCREQFKNLSWPPPNNYGAKQETAPLLAPITASIPRYYLDDQTRWQYVIEATMEDGHCWELSRYYDDFYDLQISLLSQFEEEAGKKGVPRTIPFMPGPVAYATENITNGRCRSLDNYIKALLAMPPHISRCQLVIEFFAPQSRDLEIDASPSAPEASGSPASKSRALLDGALRRRAENAENVAAAFRIFRDPLPEYATEITSLIADLYSLSQSLNSLDDLMSKPAYDHKLFVVKDDLELVQNSLRYTFQDIFGFLSEIEVRQGSDQQVYQKTWIQICTFFRNQSQDSLATRLAKYKAVLNELEDLIESKPPDTRLMDGLRANIKALLDSQNDRPNPKQDSTEIVQQSETRDHTSASRMIPPPQLPSVGELTAGVPAYAPAPPFLPPRKTYRIG